MFFSTLGLTNFLSLPSEKYFVQVSCQLKVITRNILQSYMRVMYTLKGSCTVRTHIIALLGEKIFKQIASSLWKMCIFFTFVLHVLYQEPSICLDSNRSVCNCLSAIRQIFYLKVDYWWVNLYCQFSNSSYIFYFSFPISHI
jgi:hypothetical protein